MPQPKKHDSDAQRQKRYRERMRQAATEQLIARGLPPLPPIPTIPGHRRWSVALLQAQHLIQTVAQEMADYSQERSEEWQETESAENLQDEMEQLEGVLETLGGILDETPATSAARKEVLPTRI